MNKRGDNHGEREGVLVTPFQGGEGPRPCNNSCQRCLCDPAVTGAVPWQAVPPGLRVVVCGFEPLLHKDLPSMVRRLRSGGNDITALVTNGRLCVYETVARRVAAMGPGMVVVKLFGAEPGSHDEHTGVPGSFEQALDGIRRLRASGADVRVTFPLLGGTLDGRHSEHVDLAYRLTNTLPVVLDTRDASIHPVVISGERGGVVPPERPDHPGDWRYDAVVVDGDPASPYWSPPLLPMVHVTVGMACNNRCLYCNVKGGEHQTLYDPEYVGELVRHAAATFLGHGRKAALDFIGGEPTLHPALPRMVADARANGFDWVTVCTNGRRLTNEGYLDVLVQSGVNGIRFSMHDHRPDAAGALAGRPDVGGAYPAAARLLLARRDVTPFFYRILLSSNMDSLPSYLRWLADNNKAGHTLRVHLGMPSNRGRMFENPGLFPDLSDVRKVVAEAVELADESGILLSMFHSPGCLYPDGPERSAVLNLAALQVDAVTGATTRIEFEGDTGRPEACEACEYRDHCPGLPLYYLKKDPAAAARWPVPLRRG